MSDVVAEKTVAEQGPSAAPRLVKMRRFGPAEGSTLPISLGAGAVILAGWSIVAELRLVPHLFLPTPVEVVNAAAAIFQDGYANASLFEHVGASLMRIFTAAAIAKTGTWTLEIVKRSELHRFVVLHKRWIVERTLAWISRNRRLSRDFERCARTVAAFVRLAMIRLMLRRLTRSAHCS